MTDETNDANAPTFAQGSHSPSPVRYIPTVTMINDRGEEVLKPFAQLTMNNRLYDNSTPTPSEVEEATAYEPRPLYDNSTSNVEDDDDDDEDDDDDDEFDDERFLLPAPSGLSMSLPVAHRRRSHRRRRSTGTFSLHSINDTLTKLRQEIAGKYKKYNKLLWKKSANSPLSNEIYYSVFQQAPGSNITPITELPYAPIEPEFIQAINEAKRSIDKIPPKRIPTGSSGSYFIHDSGGFPIAVFKPKDEEPYGPLSPKWTKWIHRNLFPCFFGRSCLIPNQGYICEAAASLLDRQLQTDIIPRTDIVELASDSFYYGWWWWCNRDRNDPPKPKIGSFQLFLHGYMQADEFFFKHPLPDANHTHSIRRQRVYRDDDSNDEDDYNNRNFRWTDEVIQQFREELEKLVILDYMMRNTDRGLDNWMIKIEWEGKKPFVRIGAIDSGLSMPWKFPDSWRSYPFGWLFLPVSLVGKPFSQKTRDHFLPILLSTEWWQQTAHTMRMLFQTDSEFKERMWKKQWAILKGHAFNILQTLQTPDQGPLELVRRERIMVWDDDMEVPVKIPDLGSSINTPPPFLNPLGSNGLTSFPQLQQQTTEQPPQQPNRSGHHGSASYLDERYRQIEQSRRSSLASTASSSSVASASSIWNDLIGETATNEQVGLSHAEEAVAAGEAATRHVIVERLQTVRSKPPVFTWC